MTPFQLHTEYSPSGDQPKAIDGLVDGIERGVSRQILLGVIGSGKTFTMAQVIRDSDRPYTRSQQDLGCSTVRTAPFFSECSLLLRATTIINPGLRAFH